MLVALITIPLAVAVLFLTLLLNFRASRYVLVETTSVTLFKIFLRKHGVDSASIPNAVLVDIIMHKVSPPVGSASIKFTNRCDLQEDLCVFLDGEAKLISRVLRKGPDRYSGFATTRLLVNYGIVQRREPVGMSGQEFLEAIEKEALFKELDLRLAARGKKQSS